MFMVLASSCAMHSAMHCSTVTVLQADVKLFTPARDALFCEHAVDASTDHSCLGTPGTLPFRQVQGAC